MTLNWNCNANRFSTILNQNKKFKRSVDGNLKEAASTQDQIQIILQEKNIDNLINSNLYPHTNIKASGVISLYKLLSLIQEFINNQDSRNFLYFSKNNNQRVKLVIPPFDYSQYYNKSCFLANFFFAFSTDFPAKVESTKYSVTFNVNFDSLDNRKTNINLDSFSVSYFRLITCMLFGYLFDITLNCCVCYPQNINEFIMFKSNIGLNCIKLDCQQRLVSFPQEIDFFTITKCKDVNVKYLLINQQIIALNNLNYKLDLN